MSIFNKKPWLTATLLLTLTACGGMSDTATWVARDSTITATFYEDMFARTVDATSFILAKLGAIDGSVTFDASTNVATFTPSLELAKLNTYTATLSTAITDLSGNSLLNDVSWPFTTAEGTWGTAELIETDTGTAVNPQIAFDSSGNAIAVWQQNGGDNKLNIYANRFDGTNWRAAELIETDPGIAQNPQVAFDSSGNAIAVWIQRDGDNTFSIYANRFNGTNWGAAELIETDLGPAVNPQIAFDSIGNAIAVWRQRDGANQQSIYANRFNGTNWGAAELIETDSGIAQKAQVALDSSGNAIAVWIQRDAANNQNVYANRFDGTKWAAAELIETDTGFAFGPQVAVDSNGNAIAVWTQIDGDNKFNIYANRFDGNKWGAAELIETDPGIALSPQVTFDSNSNAIAVWQQEVGEAGTNNYSIYARRFNGTNWGAAELLETETGDAGNSGIPQVAFDNSYNAIAVWQRTDDANNQNIYANRFDGTTWGTAELIETDTGYAQNPQIALDSNGNAIAVWQKPDANTNIYANRFE
jgi:hypothetical protein